MSPDERIGYAPCDPIEGHESPAERGDFEGLLKHMQEKGEIGTAKPSKKAKKSKKSK